MFKKIICLIVCAALLLGATGCVDHEDTPYEISRNVLHTIQKSLKKQNAEELYSVFSVESGATIEEIKNLFDYVGTVKSLGKAGISSCGGKKRNGKYTYYSYYGHFTAVMSSGIEYKVYFTAVAFCEEDHSRIGV